MKFLKKALCVALVACFAVVGLSACGNKEGNTAGKTYSIGTDVSFPPFVIRDGENFEGIDLNILKAISQEEGFEYNLQATGFTSAVAALEAGQVDGVIAGMTISDERKEKYDFSEPYYESGVTLAVKEGNDAIVKMEDLKGKQVAVKTGTQGALYAESKKEEYGYNVIYFDESPLMYEDVKTGNSAGCFEDYAVMSYGIKQGNGLKLVGEQHNSKPYGFAVLKGQNKELLDAFNEGLKKIKENGEYDKIIAEYVTKD